MVRHFDPYNCPEKYRLDRMWYRYLYDHTCEDVSVVINTHVHTLMD